jgi:type II secretion system protein N
VLRSRPLRITAIALAALVLTSTFVYLGFPYELLAHRVAREVQSATGYVVSYGPVGASPGLLGPGIAIDELHASDPEGGSFDFSRVRLRPAWSLSWLTARPAFFVDAQSSLGHVRGVTTLRGPLAFDGEVREIDLTSLLAGALPQGTELTGVLDVVADVQLAEQGAEGSLSLTAREGQLAYPGLPLDVPYDQIEGELRLGGEATAEILSLTIQSPMGSGSITGTIGPSPVLSRAPLDLSLEITAADGIRGAIEAQGVRFGQDGTISLKVGGTVTRPTPANR